MAVVVGARDIPHSALVRQHPGGFHHHKNRNLPELLESLFTKGTRSVYLEGGPTLASAFVAQRLVNEFHITMGPMLLGGPQMAIQDLGISTMSDSIRLDIRDVTRSDNDVIVIAQPLREGA
jgi:diaminohydroxyphosphoribosylaminopyrimidine deaminase/5-amino-6-(5-phosphoribosylamino)uracil reductase